MIEVYDLRLFGRTVPKYLPAEIGETLGSVRRVVTARGSAEFDTVTAAIARETRKAPLLASWRVRRKYSRLELRQAKRFLLLTEKLVEPAGEECGTVYDASTECPVCHAGARQSGALFVRGKTVRGDADVRRTIGGEVILSAKTRDVMVQAGVPSEMFGEVFVRRRGGFDVSESHLQLLMSSPYVKVGPRTKFGEDPFDAAGGGRCVRGDTEGLNILSELTIMRDSLVEERGLCHTATFVGDRRGLLRPERLTVVSRRVYEALTGAKISGCRFEVVREED